MNAINKARERAKIILEVRSGKISATQGAELLGISRKTYYEWEKRGLAGMMEELKDGEAGRPPQPPDPEKIRMEEKIAKLEAKVKELESVSEVREIISQLNAWRGSKKKPRS